MVVFSPVVDLYVYRGAAHRGAMAGLRVRLLPQGARARAQRPQAEGAEGGAAGEARVRRHIHDRGQGLGRRAHLRPNYHRTNTGNYHILYPRN